MEEMIFIGSTFVGTFEFTGLRGFFAQLPSTRRLIWREATAP